MREDSIGGKSTFVRRLDSMFREACGKVQYKNVALMTNSMTEKEQAINE